MATKYLAYYSKRTKSSSLPSSVSRSTIDSVNRELGMLQIGTYKALNSSPLWSNQMNTFSYCALNCITTPWRACTWNGMRDVANDNAKLPIEQLCRDLLHSCLHVHSLLFPQNSISINMIAIDTAAKCKHYHFVER